MTTSCALDGATATVGGQGTVAHVLRTHLSALGAEVRDGHVENGPAARVSIELDHLRRELVVDWAGAVDEPGIVDETTTQAVCGVMHVHGRRYGTPRGLAVDYCSTAAGVLGVTGLLTGLLCDAPDITVTTSVAETALLTVSQYLAAAGSDDPEAVDLRPGGPPFTAADGTRFEIETLDPARWAAFWAALDVDPKATGRGWKPFQHRYATATAALPSELAAAALASPFADLQAVGARTGVDVCRLHTAIEGGLISAGVPWELGSGSGAGPRAGTGSIQRPLAGRVVLEAGRRIQAPLAAHVLGLLGATVVRIEPPGGDPLRGTPPCSGALSARWLALNRGKDAVQLDIKSPTGRDGLRALAARADVFLHNWAPGTAERLGLGPADLTGVPVYAYTSGWHGSAIPDPPIGTDFMVQARSGLAELLTTGDAAPAPSLMTVLDVLGGLIGAEAVLAGMLHGRRAGTRTCVRSSLFGAAAALHPVGPPKRRPPGFRRPSHTGNGWSMAPDTGPVGPPVTVTTDLTALVEDPRMAAVIGRDEHGCPALSAPWRYA